MIDSIPPFRCWAEIDLAVLERNLFKIRAALPKPIRYVAVVKADAYGHGVAPTVSRLMRSGADMFAVANMREAMEIQEIGKGWPVLVLSAMLPHEDVDLAVGNIIPTISSSGEVERFNAVARKVGRRLAVHMKIDTGMGRLGIWHEKAADLYREIQEAEGLVLTGMYTHFCSADGDPEFTEHQRKLFIDTLRQFKGLDPRNMLIHADNSAGLETLSRNQIFNAVRVGLLQFGVLPYPDSILAKAEVEPVFSFYTRVGLIKELPRGMSISYGRTRVLEKATKVAVLTAGYGDGIPTTMSNRGEVLIHGKRCPILGRVTMDQTIVDVSEVENLQTGDVATLIGEAEGERLSITEFCRASEQIPWEVLVSVTKRVSRVYRADTAI